jgi:hypothetical protein
VRNTVPSPPDVIDSLSFEPLTPTAFVDRAAAAHGDRIGIADGDRGGRSRAPHSVARISARVIGQLRQPVRERRARATYRVHNTGDATTI